MTILKTLLSLLVLAIFAICFMTFDMADLDLKLPSGTLLRENSVAMGIFGGFLLMAVIADRRVSNKTVS